MNTNTNKLKTTLTALSLITGASVFTVSAAHAATQNEVQFTAVDPEGFDDNLYGARYVRYLEEVSGNSGAYLINPAHYEYLMESLRMMRLPDKRPDRYYPRVVRKRPTKYPTKKNASQLN